MMNNELYHHGILGQKWGVRRYQNSDGTYTQEGKIRKREGRSSGINKDTAKKVAIGAAALGTAAAAALYVSKHPEVVAEVVNAAKNLHVNELPKKLIEKGKDAAKTALNQAIKGVKDGFKEAPYKVAKAAAEGAAILVAKKVLDETIGKENINNYIKSYNAYNKKNKIGRLPGEGGPDNDE